MAPDRGAVVGQGMKTRYKTRSVFVYLRLTWKCEVGAHLGLKRLIWG